MPKVIRGRVAGLYGMDARPAEDLDALADEFDRVSRLPNPGDDPDWLLRWAKRLRGLAEQKEKARERKADGRRRNDRVARDASGGTT